MPITLHRRSFVAGLLAMPAVVRSSSLMRVSALAPCVDDGVALMYAPHPVSSFAIAEYQDLTADSLAQMMIDIHRQTRYEARKAMADSFRNDARWLLGRRA